jgi:hypothetical protein
MEKEQMMTRLLAEIRTNREEMRAGQEHLKEEMMVKLNAHYEWMMAGTDSQLETMGAARDIFEGRLNEMDTTDLEANREKSEALAEQQDVPKTEAAVKNIGAPKDRYGDRHLAAGCRRQLKKRTQGDGGSRQKLAAARGRLNKPCRSCTAQGIRSSKTRKGQRCTRSP